MPGSRSPIRQSVVLLTHLWGAVNSRSASFGVIAAVLFVCACTPEPEEPKESLAAFMGAASERTGFVSWDGDFARVRVDEGPPRPAYPLHGLFMPDLGAEIGFSGLEAEGYQYIHWLTVFDSLAGTRPGG